MKFNKRTVRVFSRHPSHKDLRKSVLFPMISCIRLGSTTERAEKWNRSPLQINTIEAIKISSNKIKMKTAFDDNNINTPEWWLNREDIPENAYPIIAKKIYGSRALGIKMIIDESDFSSIGNLSGYYFEKYYNYAREYRIHATQDRVFYTCRKLMRNDTPEDKKFFKNDSNCVWIRDDTSPEQFNKPENWNEICREAVKAITSVGLDVGAVDIRVKTKNTDEFKIIEVNSAPSFGEITLEKYKLEIPKILQRKFDLINNY